MDGELSSSRYNPGGSNNNNSNNNGGSSSNNSWLSGGRGGGGGGGGYRGGRGRGGRGGYYNNRRGGHNRNNHYNNNRRHYNNNNNNNRRYNNNYGGGNRSGNRFGSNRGHGGGSSSVDPQNAMWVQLSAMVAQMSNTAASTKGDDTNNNEAVVVKNMMDLIQVLTTENNAPLFLNLKLCQLIVHCAAALPLHTPSYAALTFGLHQYSSTNNTTHTNDYKIAPQCVEHACQQLAWDIPCLISATTTTTTTRTATTTTNVADAYMRIKLVLRYLTLLSHIGILQWDNTSDATTEGTGMTLSQFLIWLLDQKDVLLTSLVYSTIPYLLSSVSKDWIQVHLLQNDNNKHSTIMMHSNHYKSLYEPGLGIHSLLLQEEQYEPNTNTNQDSDDDSDDDDDDDSDDDEDAVPCADTFMDLHRTVNQLVMNHDDDDDVDDTQTSSNNHNFTFLTSAPWKQLWSRPTEPNNNNNNDNETDKIVKMEPEDDTTMDNQPPKSTEPTPLTYTQSPLLLFTEKHPDCIIQKNNNGKSNSKLPLINNPIDAIVFGRLSLFGTNGDDEDDDDDDDNEDAEEQANNPQLKAYMDHFTLVDRYFLGESIRDVLYCHRCKVSDTGVDKGSTKDVAEQIWSTSQLFLHAKNKNNCDHQTSTTMDTSEESSPTQQLTAASTNGIEYGIVETMLSLLLQQSHHSSMSHVYLSKVLLDLTKLQPKTIPQALVVAVSSLILEYLPNLVPSARENLSHWFAFHLTNTDYQWPAAYWNLYSANTNNSNGCRAHFLQRTLYTMCDFVSTPTILITNYDTGNNNDNNQDENDQQSKPESPIAKLLYQLYHVNLNDNPNENSLSEEQQDREGMLQQQLQQRIWTKMDDPDSVREYMVGDEISSVEEQGIKIEDDETTNVIGISNGTAANLGKIWWRTSLVIRSLFLPATKDFKKKHKSLRLLQKTYHNPAANVDETFVNPDGQTMDQKDANHNHMEINNEEDDDDEDDTTDVLADINNALQRYRPVIMATLAKDAQAHEENLQLNGQQPQQEDDGGSLSVLGEISILQLVYKCTSYSPHVIFTSCLEYLIQTQIVSAMAIFKWILQYETASATMNQQEDSNNNSNYVCSNVWWNYASLALRVDLVNNVTKVTDEHSDMTATDDHDIGMVIDTVGVKYEEDCNHDAKDPNSMDEDELSSPSLDRMKKVIQFICPLVQYAARTICTVLIDLNENYSTIYGKSRKYKKRMLPLEVNLVEGFKHLIRSTWKEINDSFMDAENDSVKVANTTGEQEDTITTANVAINENRQKFDNLLSKSSLSGNELASYCRSSCPKYQNTFAELIVQSLDRL